MSDYATTLVVSSTTSSSSNNNNTNTDNNNLIYNYPLDSLAYLDNELLDPNTKAEVQELIHEEMQLSKLTPQQYLIDRLKKLNIPIISKDSLSLYSSHSEIVNNSYTELNQNLGKFSNNPETIRNKLMKKLNSQIHSTIDISNSEQLQLSTELLQHTQSQIEKLKLLAPNQWKSINSQFDKIKQHIEFQYKQQQTSTDEINRKRKTSQLLIEPQLTSLEKEFQSGIGKNLEIQLATVQLQENIKRLKKQAEDAGIDISTEVSELSKYFTDYTDENQETTMRDES